MRPETKTPSPRERVPRASKARAALLPILLPILAAVLLAGAAWGQPAPIPFHTVPFSLHTGLWDGSTGLEARTFTAFREVIRVEKAPWLQLHFREASLGKASYLAITSLEDGASQRLDAESFAQWRGSSAYFNGDAVTVELRVAPGDEEVFVLLGDEITVGDRAGEAPAELPQEFICAAADDRVASNDPAVGRVVPVGCTGWIVANGAHLTAGHCAFAADTLEFNVPASDPDGTINHPGPQDQYAIDAASMTSVNGGPGNDWAVYATFSNSNTGLLPVAAQGAFYRMSRDSSPTLLRGTGYGVDGPPPCYGESRICTPAPRDSTSQTQQTDTGNFVAEVGSGSRVELRHRISVTGGNSGGPLIVEGTVLTVGIVTHAGCTAAGGYNNGTSFEHDTLETTLQTFPGPSVTYVDRGHPIAFEDGTVLRPWNTLGEGVGTAATGGTVSIVTGTYDEPAMTLNRAMTLTAPVGLVTIK